MASKKRTRKVMRVEDEPLYKEGYRAGYLAADDALRRSVTAMMRVTQPSKEARAAAEALLEPSPEWKALQNALDVLTRRTTQIEALVNKLTRTVFKDRRKVKT